jgi:hypothetical protein
MTYISSWSRIPNPIRTKLLRITKLVQVEMITVKTMDFAGLSIEEVDMAPTHAV